MRTQTRPSTEAEIQRLTVELEEIKASLIRSIRASMHNAKNPAEAGSEH